MWGENNRNPLFSKILYWVCQAEVRDDVHPEQGPDSDQLVEWRPEEQEKQVYPSSVLKAFLLNYIHYGSWNL